jgi:hypothetical protein
LPSPGIEPRTLAGYSVKWKNVVEKAETSKGSKAPDDDDDDDDDDVI